MFWNQLLHRPQSLRIRKALFQVHLWTGLVAGLYILIVCTSGAALVFRGEIQRSRYAEFFPREAPPGREAPMERVVENIRSAYSDHALVGVGAPTDEQHTFTGYISRDERFRAVFADAASGEVIGALDTGSLLLSLQNLHFYLMAGSTGLMVNGIGGLALFLMAVTGIGIWWPGRAQWKRNLRVAVRSGSRRLTWDLHSATGIWSAAFIAMWALTGAYFAFPQQYRNVVSTLSPVTSRVLPVSDVDGRRSGTPSLTALIARAEAHVPGSRLVRVSLPTTDDGVIQVIVTRARRAAVENDDYVYVYFDRFSGAIIGEYDLGQRSLGDRLMPWFGRLHVGNFGGIPLKIVWFSFGLGPALLFVTGVLLWWKRVVMRGPDPRGNQSATT